jgi:Sulfatase
MKTLLQPIAVGLGITTICLLWDVNPLVDPSHNTIYHWCGPASTIFLPVICDFCGCWLLLTLLLLSAQRYERLQLYLWTGIALLLPWIVLQNVVIIRGVGFSFWISLIQLASSLIAFLLLLTRWRRSLQASFERLQRLMVTLFSFVAVIGLLMLCQLFWFVRQARGLNSEVSTRHVRQAATSSSGRTRVVWILLDELSYQQVYERRFPGLKLPAFDQLAAQATVFTHVVPAGINTEEVLPSLMTGQPIDDIRSSASGQLFTHAPSESWKHFDQHQTVFQDAVNAGYNTGITGWYNPYCRILPEVLDSCFWVFSQPAKNHMNSRSSARENLIVSFRRFSREADRLHVEDFRELSQAADAMLHDNSLNFILLHMPVPHPYGIYNRATGSFATKHTSYIDNLALADRYLAHVREVLERSGEWNASAIIVMGDHSWRTQRLWLKSAGWTPEDQLASHGGQFDDRPAYIVKLPHQLRSARIDSPFEAVKTRQLLDAIMKNEIASAESLSALTR